MLYKASLIIGEATDTLESCRVEGVTVVVAAAAAAAAGIMVCDWKQWKVSDWNKEQCIMKNMTKKINPI